MSLSKKEFSDYIKQFNFRELFNDMGWNNDKTTQPIVVDNTIYTLKAVAEKCGLKILTCEANELPNNETRRKLDTQIKRLFFHYILICVDKEKNQKWIIPIKKSEKRELTGIDYASHQVPEFLYQKVSDLTFSFEQEENLTIVDVSNLVNEIFTVNSEKVTKQFYDKFKKEHGSFQQFIKGIQDKANQDWYASLMLNRLMFCYFIQKKGFLDNNKNYLRDKLKACKEKKGKVKFYSFYRDFLLVLFHKGLNEPTQSHETKIEIGKIPYLNGGLFDEHELEKIHTGIDIDDQAFERLFDFFDQYEWHLDTRITATGKDINPDVIGYIFEKYINDRANMGAYYTKEDITDYISKNCILPYLFDETKRNYAKAFARDGEVWQMVKNSGDEYIYPAVKHGIYTKNPVNQENQFNPVPDYIEPGIKDVSKRTEWNKSAPPEYALPTEIWREVVDRRNRYTEVKTKIDKGEINAINDFITYNLNIRQFAQDAVENTNDPELLKHFYKALNRVTIIDPTCGSGAFLFAAMNILEPLYEACIQRMEIFLEEAKDENNYKNLSPELQKSWKSINHSTSWFRQCLAQVKSPEHPNLQYFIYKSIILRNLYGVDIMKEAVEIAKLRLFLKLVATVEADYRKPNLGLEPLPDIDFNIRAGNTLVGFATEKELEKALVEDLLGAIVKGEIEEKCEIVANAFKRYKEIQLTYGDDFKEFKKAKEELNKRLKELNHELNQLLHKQASGLKYDHWLQTHQPFHWFAEFYEIVQGNGGFDVIIGNPPYVVYTATNSPYKLKDYDTLTCANLYAYCAERSFNIMHSQGRFGMIIPNSSISADKLSPLQKIFVKDKTSWISNYAWRPAKLFEGANMLLAIVLSVKDNEKIIRTSVYYKWYNDYREVLFEAISYNDATKILQKGTIPKIPSNQYYSIIQKLKKKSGNKRLIDFFRSQPTKHKFFYFRAVLYWVKILEAEPVFREDGVQTTTGEMKPVYVDSEDLKYILISLLSSSLFFVHYITWSSCQVINSRDFELPFDFNSLAPELKSLLVNLGKKLQRDLQDNSIVQIRNYSARDRSFTMEKQYFYIKKSKSIIDEIDSVLAKHYGFTNEELNFIINYDIKTRLGKDLEKEDEE